MKKLFVIILLFAGLAYFGILPFRAHDVAELLPVETVIVSREDGQIRIDVGAGVHALGRTLSEALAHLREQVSGFVFFQTAEQVIVQENAADTVSEIVEESAFRPAAGIYRTPDADLDPDAVSRYLHTRHTALTLSEAKAASAYGEPPKLPTLVSIDSGFRILA